MLSEWGLLSLTSSPPSFKSRSENCVDWDAALWPPLGSAVELVAEDLEAALADFLTVGLSLVNWGNGLRSSWVDLLYTSDWYRKSFPVNRTFIQCWLWWVQVNESRLNLAGQVSVASAWFSSRRCAIGGQLFLLFWLDWLFPTRKPLSLAGLLLFHWGWLLPQSLSI